jgi:hypothetical protein
MDRVLSTANNPKPKDLRLARRFSRGWVGFLRNLIVVLVVAVSASTSCADPFDESPPEWERLLWGGTIGVKDEADAGSAQSQTHAPSVPPETPSAALAKLSAPAGPGHVPLADGVMVRSPAAGMAPEYCRSRYREIVLKNIPPLYLSPPLAGEGIWQAQNLPAGADGKPVMFRTSYRPSIDYPNAVAHMLLFDMSRLSMRLYLGSAEPGGSKDTAMIPSELRPTLLAITNALWKQKHSGDAGTVFRGNVVKELASGMATLVVYQDDSVDIVEWAEGIPTSLVRDARQLRHLIVKDGKVVDSIVRAGQLADGEIGLGFLLAEEPAPGLPPSWYGYAPTQSQTNYGPDWFIASRSAFGIRPDGNLVFAVGHHISTRDLAKAMVLAGCERAIHGDANPHNVLGNLYFVGADGSVLKKEKLSPEQRNGTLDRYVDKSYTSDFFGFFLRSGERGSL